MPTSFLDPIVIVDGARTPMGGFQGDFATLSAPQLGAVSIQSAIRKAGLNADNIDAVMMGCVLPAGLGQAPARQASLQAGLAQQTGCTTVNKMCGSGMQAIMLAHDGLLAGTSRVTVAGGMESMSNAPYLLPKARAGMRMGHGQIKDHMFLDGLEDAYQPGKLMGHFADATAARFDISRDAQDQFAITSLKRALHAIDSGIFDTEIQGVPVKNRSTEKLITVDEQPPKANIEKIARLRPAFNEDGTVTAANASSISDGAASVVMMRESEASRLGLQPRARVLGHSNHAQAPEWFTTAPVHAIDNLLKKLNATIEDIDLFEINEAFAVVTMAAMKELHIPHEKVNVYGGACALGHPIGASGARIIVTLMNALERHALSKGVASLCIGGGEATAIALERIV